MDGMIILLAVVEEATAVPGGLGSETPSEPRSGGPEPPRNTGGSGERSPPEKSQEAPSNIKNDKAKTGQL